MLQSDELHNHSTLLTMTGWYLLNEGSISRLFVHPPPHPLTNWRPGKRVSLALWPLERCGEGGAKRRLTLWNRHFRVVASLCFKSRLSAKVLIREWFLILMQIKLIFTRKVLHQVSFWKWEIFGTRKFESGLFEIKESLSREKKTSIKCQQQIKKFFFRDLHIGTLFGFISAAPGFCHSRAYTHSCCLC